MKLAPSSPPNELCHLDLMRLIACVGVVLYHSIEYFVPALQRESLAASTKGLALFVDLFFVISGFVISYVYDGRVTSLASHGRFLQRRVGRLIPLHWLTLLVAIILWWLASILNLKANHSPTFSLACIMDTALLAHSYVPCGNNIFFNFVSWSISAEMIMYIAFPLFARIGGKYPQLLLAMALVGAAATVTAISFIEHESVLNVLWTNVHPIVRALPAFVFGCALFYNRNLFSKVRKPLLSLTVLLMFLITAMLTGVSQIIVLTIVFIVGALTISCDVQRKTSRLIRKVAPIGQLTYSVYMWHVIIISLFMNALGDKYLHLGQTGMTILAIICYALLAAVSYLSFVCFETPARKWVDGLKIIRR